MLMKLSVHLSSNRSLVRTNQKARIVCLKGINLVIHDVLVTILFSQIENETDQDSPNCSNETLSNHVPISFPSYITNIEATFTNTGGELCAPLNSDVRIIVPSGAVPAEINQPVFFKVFSDETTLLRDIPEAPKRTLISPVVECGPHDIHLSKPVEIIVPHCLCLSEAKKESITVYRCGRFSVGVEGSQGRI